MRLVIITLMMMSAVLSMVSAAQVEAPALRTISGEDFQLLSQDPDPALPGSFVEVRIRVENIGREEMNDVLFQLQPDYPFSVVPGDNGERKLGTVNANQIGEDAFVLYYRLMIDQSAVSGEYELRMRYTMDGGKTWRVLDPKTIRIENEAPLLSVSKVETESVQPGGTAAMKMTLVNMADFPLRNLKVALQLVTTTAAGIVELPFSPIGSTNEQAVKLMKTSEVKTVSFDLAVDADAQVKAYKIPVQISYIDEQGDSHVEAHVVSMIVAAEPDLMISKAEESYAIQGQDGTLSVAFTNRGLGQIKFLSFEVIDEGPYDLLTPAEIYVGNIDSDDYETADINFRCSDCSGDQTFRLKITYADENNKEYEKEMTFTTMVYSSDEAKEKGLIPQNNSVGIIIVVVIVVVGVILYRVFRKKKH